jgi:hypothetical protein
MPFGPTRSVSDMAVENGPPRVGGAVDLSRDDVLVGAIG